MCFKWHRIMSYIKLGEKKLKKIFSSFRQDFCLTFIYMSPSIHVSASNVVLH